MWQEIHVDGNSDDGNGAHDEQVNCRLDRVHFSLVDSRIGMINLPHSQIGGCSPSVRTSRRSDRRRRLVCTPWRFSASQYHVQPGSFTTNKQVENLNRAMSTSWRAWKDGSHGHLGRLETLSRCKLLFDASCTTCNDSALRPDRVAAVHSSVVSFSSSSRAVRLSCPRWSVDEMSLGRCKQDASGRRPRGSLLPSFLSQDCLLSLLCVLFCAWEM
jgi:hypothetical protein